jgi:Tol biopolymer transport system component
MWSPEGTRVAYFSDEEGPGSVYIISSGGGRGRRILPLGTRDYPNSWSPDGRLILFERREPGGNWNLYTAPVDTAQTDPSAIAAYLPSRFNVRSGEFSPDGRLVAYASDETGGTEVYLQTFPASSFKIRVSRDGGTWPRWRPDGRELYFVAPDLSLNAVAIQGTGSQVQLGPPEALFTASFGTRNQSGQLPPYDVAPDGRRFVIRTSRAPMTEPLTVLLNWRPNLGE